MSIFYKLISKNGKISYLFGTISDKEPMRASIPLEIKKAFVQSTTCVFEVDNEKLMKAFLSDNQDEQDEISFEVSQSFDKCTAEWYQQSQPPQKLSQTYIDSARKNLDARIQHANTIDPNLSAPFQNMLKNIKRVPPIRIGLKLMDAYSKTDINLEILDLLQERAQTLDGQLMREALLKNKTVHSLISLADEYRDKEGYALNFQEQIECYELIEKAVREGIAFATKKEIARAYVAQDLSKLTTLAAIFPATINIPDSVRKYLDGINRDRDLDLAVKMQPAIENGNAFVAVHASRLKGITEHLQRAGYTVEPIPLSKSHYPILSTEEEDNKISLLIEKEKIAAFKKIYRALYAAQSSLFKSKPFVRSNEDILSLEQIQNNLHDRPNSRTTKAWELAEEHYLNISSTNTVLLQAICQYGYEKSSHFLGVFKRTRTNLEDTQTLATISSNTRTGMVRDILDGFDGALIIDGHLVGNVDKKLLRY